MHFSLMYLSLLSHTFWRWCSQNNPTTDVKLPCAYIVISNTFLVKLLWYYMNTLEIKSEGKKQKVVWLKNEWKEKRCKRWMKEEIVMEGTEKERKAEEVSSINTSLHGGVTLSQQ